MSSTPVVNDSSGAATSMFSGSTSRGLKILREREFGVGIIAGIGAMVLLGSNGGDALQFAGIAALANSVGDAAANAVELRTNFAAYDYNYWYMDFTDMATAALAAGGMFWYLGASGNVLLYSAGITGVAAGVGPKVSTYISDMLDGKTA